MPRSTAGGGTARPAAVRVASPPLSAPAVATIERDAGVLREGLRASQKAGNDHRRDREQPGNAKLHGTLP